MEEDILLDQSLNNKRIFMHSGYGCIRRLPRRLPRLTKMIKEANLNRFLIRRSEWDRFKYGKRLFAVVEDEGHRSLENEAEESVLIRLHSERSMYRLRFLQCLCPR